jgi:hypothetical protein
VNVSKSSDPERLNNICVANVSDKAAFVKHGSIHMNDREFWTSKSLNVREREYRCLCSYYIINTYASLMYELKKKNWKHIYE